MTVEGGCLITVEGGCLMTVEGKGVPHDWAVCRAVEGWRVSAEGGRVSVEGGCPSVEGERCSSVEGKGA